MNLKFFKMHGAGNDYVFVDTSKCAIDDPQRISRAISQRHFYIGSDGLILISPSSTANCMMHIFNSDGSEGKICGNGMRCVAKYLYDTNICRQKEMTIETLGGVHKAYIETDDFDKIKMISVEMGKYKIDNMKNKLGDISVVSLENLHAVLFYDNDVDVEALGCEIQKCGDFPDSVNVEFVKILSDNELYVRVYERGSGETLSCGSGACAAAIAYSSHYDGVARDICVHMSGGDLLVSIGDGDVTLSGGADFVFYGECDI